MVALNFESLLEYIKLFVNNVQDKDITPEQLQVITELLPELYEIALEEEEWEIVSEIENLAKYFSDKLEM